MKASDTLQRESFAPASWFGLGAGHDEPAPSTPRAAELAINGRFLEQCVTGVQRVSREVTREIDSLIGEGEFDIDATLYHPPTADPRELQLRNIRTRSVGRLRGAAWEQTALPLAVAGRPLLCLGNSAPLLSLLGRARVGVMIHDLSYLDHPEAYRRIYRWSHSAMLPLVLSRAGKLFLVSQSERERLLGIRSSIESKISVAPNGGWTERGDSTSGTASLGRLPDGYALFVGSLSHRKNFSRLLQCAIRLAREDGLPFVFAGSSGSVLTRPRLDVPPDLRDRIFFVGQVDDPSLLGQLYRGARVLVFPSLYEASPLPPFEAAHFGCPVVASNIPSMWERCDDAVTYCNPRSVESIVLAVRRILHDDQERERQIRVARQRASRASWREQARTILSAMFDPDVR